MRMSKMQTVLKCGGGGKSTLDQDNRQNIYNLSNFIPQIINEAYLKNLGIEIKISELTMKRLELGSKIFRKKWEEKKLYPKANAELVDYDLDKLPIAQTYTGVCPANVFRFDPVYGCYFGCLYCLDTDGFYDRPITVYRNYDKYVRKYLNAKEGVELFYYLSAVTDPFQETILETGVIHNVLKEFITHYKRYPDSTQQLFMATKAGPQHILFNYQGNSIIDLLRELPSEKVQFNVSVGFMPEYLTNLLEPNAASIDDRLRMMSMCQEAGIAAKSVLTQPILGPYLSQEAMDTYFTRIKSFGITNFKPEFATITLENLVIIGQLVGYFDKVKEKELYESYIDPDNQGHKKGLSDRIAPDRSFYHDALVDLYTTGEKYGMTMTLCNWIRTANSIKINEIPILKNKGKFPCL